MPRVSIVNLDIDILLLELGGKAFLVALEIYY